MKQVWAQIESNRFTFCRVSEVLLLRRIEENIESAQMLGVPSMFIVTTSYSKDNSNAFSRTVSLYKRNLSDMYCNTCHAHAGT